MGWKRLRDAAAGVLILASRSARPVAGALLVAIVVAGCASGTNELKSSPRAAGSTATVPAEPEPVPWSVAAGASRWRQGEVHEVLSVGAGNSMANLVEEWLTFDLDASFIDRRIGLSPALFDDGRRREPATRDAPSLRFLYGLSGVIMWHPDAETQCGTGWVRMTPESLEASTGLAIDPEQSLALESLQVLADAPSTPELVTNDEAGTTYVIQVPGGTGLKASAPVLDDPDVTDAITRDERPALVRLPRDGGPIEIEVDLTYALAAASAGKDIDATRMTLRWLLTPAPGPVATTLPAEVADPATCEPDRG